MEEKRGFWQIVYDEIGLDVPPGKDTWGTRFGLLAGGIVSPFPRPIRRVLRWPLQAVALLIWILVILPLEAIGRLIKRLVISG